MGEKNISDAELELMKIIWKCKDKAGNYDFISTNDIMEQIKDKWNVSTVFTLLSRLEKKGFVRSAKAGRNNVYAAVVMEKSYLEDESRRFINKLYDGSIKNLLTAFCDEKVSKEELDEIEKFLEERKKSQG